MELVTVPTRPSLTRARILEAALRYIDERGLAALSMHKLGADLGVKAMSLYNHVAGRDDVLDGVVELLWVEIEVAAPATGDWLSDYRAFGDAIWLVISGHPNAGPLIVSREIMPAAALRLVRDHVAAGVHAGLTEPHAYALLRTVTAFALGHALAYLNWEQSTACAPAIADMLKPDVPGELVDIAENFCGQADPRAEFELGLDLMLHGISVQHSEARS